VRLLAWRALDAIMSQHPSGPELALHAKILGSTTGVEVINDLIGVVGVTAYDQRFPIFGHLMDALSYPSSKAATSASAAANSTPCSAPPTTTRCRLPAWPDLELSTAVSRFGAGGSGEHCLHG
jgi:hypothetical protein